jgi:hypothetical protein
MDDDLAVGSIDLEADAPVSDSEALLGPADELAELRAVGIGGGPVECGEHALRDGRVKASEVAARAP